MSKGEKILNRFLSKPKDFRWSELKRLLGGLGYKEVKTGKTSGSRVSFMEPESKHVISLHKPHPTPVLKRYQLDEIESTLRERGVIKNER